MAVVGLEGLAQNINTTESAMSDLSVLERMDERIQTDRTKEITAQQQEQLMYERAYAMSDKLLEKDRIAINKRIGMFQQQVSVHMRDNGGSRKRFMEKGGLSIMNRITNDIMRSPEAVRYEENKKNLAKIIEIKEKGLGHLLAPTDQQSLEDYESSEFGGQITYSGILAEIEIPPSSNFDYGTEIPLEKILSQGSNMMKIKANYKINYPERGEPSYAQIYAFAKKMGYGGTGSNAIRLRLATAERVRKARESRNRQTKATAYKNSYLSQLNTLKSQIDGGLSVQDINEKYDGNMIEALSKDNPSFAKLLGGAFEPKSRRRNLTEQGPDPTDFADPQDVGVFDTAARVIGYFSRDMMGLKEAHRILPHNTKEIAERLFDQEILNGEIVGFEPSESDFRMDGVKLTGEFKLDDQHKGNYKLLGVTTALKAKIASNNGEEALLVNAYNDDGTLDKKSSAKLDEAYGDSETIMTTVMAFENKDGNIFYREIDMSDPQIKTVFSNALGDDDDLTETVEQDKRSAQELYLREKMLQEDEIVLRGSIKAMEEKVFQDPVFESEGETYYGAGSAGQENRYPMMKAFYMAFDYVRNSNIRNAEFPQGDPNVYPKQVQQAIDKNLFTTSAIHGGIEDNLKDYDTQGNSPERMIDTWLTNMNNSTESNLGKRRNSEIAQKWAQVLSLMESEN